MTYVAFDIETAAVLEDDQRPDPGQDLGITCATLASAAGPAVPPTIQMLTDRDGVGYYAPRWSRGYAAAVVTVLEELVLRGDRLITWNGLQFDLQVLAHASGEYQRCAEIATSPAHVDLMYCAHCSTGYPVSLAAAAKALGLTKGTTVVQQGSQAPKLWAQAIIYQCAASCGQDGRLAEANQLFAEVLAYNVSDATLTLAIAHGVLNAGALQWITTHGRQAATDFRPYGWTRGNPDALTVKSASHWPHPAHPLFPRRHFWGWTVRHLTQAKAAHLRLHRQVLP